MKRRLFILLAAISLVTFVAVVAVWVRSYFAYDTFERLSMDSTGQDSRVVAVRFSEGRFEFTYQLLHVPSSASIRAPLRGNVLWEHSGTAPPIDEHRKWWWYDHPPRSALSTFAPRLGGWVDVWTVGLQLWVVAVLVLLPFPWIVRHVSFNRYVGKKGFCSRCGYDLRATPERCPECGTVVEISK